ncbi:MAG: hypothetical protein J6Z30_07760 [Pyramidobacter sp.]|jgi:hypothetical protein|nr:hypothetical protein [Pyramidobacter sp.]
MKALILALALSAFSDAAFAASEGAKTSIQIAVGGKTYAVRLEDSETARAIAAKLPLALEMKRFGGHEFYASLPFTPPFAARRTSKIKAGGVYYWDGWNAFVINYIDWDISPYEVVHIGDIEDASICAALEAAAEPLAVEVQ